MSKKIIRITILLLWMALIFCFSAQPAAQSTVTSGGIVARIAGWIGNILHIDMSAQVQDGSLLTVIVRKLAHFTLFAILGICMLRAWYAFAETKRTAWLALLCAAAYAVTDELHQVFVPGRAGRITDVLIDTVGAAVGIGIWLLCIKRKKTRHSRHCTEKL